MSRNCIFHIPNKLDKNGKSGSQIRPRKMKRALEEIGYEVDEIQGSGHERKEAIRRIKGKIREGIHYDFLYSESSTMPTLLTEKHHMPTYPFLDFGFFKFCKKHGIPIGLFYRDVYWKFDVYAKSVPLYQRLFSIPMYKYDLKKYDQLLDILYLPSLRMKTLLSECRMICTKALPPGAVFSNELVEKKQDYYLKRRKDDKIKLFYVGGVSGLYDIGMILKTICERDDIEIIVCCKENEWNNEKERYKNYLTDNVKVVHVTGEGLEKYYLWADICCCYFEASGYRDMAVPIKLFEYIGHITPIIATDGTEAGRMVEQADIGWTIPYREQDFTALLDHIISHPKELFEKHINMLECLKQNTWEQRAWQVKDDLTGQGKHK